MGCGIPGCRVSDCRDEQRVRENHARRESARELRERRGLKPLTREQEDMNLWRNLKGLSD